MDVDLDVDFDGDGDGDLAGERRTSLKQPSLPTADTSDMLSFQRLGAGRWSDADSANRYTIARGEAMESAASLDVMRLRKLVSDERYARGIHLLEGIVAMLTKML